MTEDSHHVPPPNKPQISFTVSCVPPTALHHSKKIVRKGRFTGLADTPELQNTKAFLTTLFREHAPKEPLTGALELFISIRFPWLKKHSAKTRALVTIPHITKPDCSNLAKTIEDVLASLRFFENDSQIASLVVTKRYYEPAGIRIRIEQVDD